MIDDFPGCVKNISHGRDGFRVWNQLQLLDIIKSQGCNGTSQLVYATYNVWLLDLWDFLQWSCRKMSRTKGTILFPVVWKCHLPKNAIFVPFKRIFYLFIFHVSPALEWIKIYINIFIWFHHLPNYING